MKNKFLFLFMVIVMSMSIASTKTIMAAEMSGSCGDNTTWILYDNNTLEISGSGCIDDNSGWEDYCEDIQTVIINKNITEIDQYIFNDCTSLSKVSLPDTLTTIGKYSFSGCTSLQKLEIPNSVNSIHKYAFKNSDSIVIYCREDSYALSFAQSNNIGYRIIGNITVSFDANGGNGQPSDTQIETNKSFSIPTKAPLRSGYFFVGWSTDKDATEAEYYAKDSVSFEENTTLYAVWAKCELLTSSNWESIKISSLTKVNNLTLYVVAYKDNKCTSIIAKNVDLIPGNNIIPVSSNIANADKEVVKVFLWSDMCPCCESIAVDDVKEYTVKFLDWDENIIDTQIISMGENATIPVNPKRTGYQFCGWSDDGTNINSNKTILAQYIDEKKKNTFKVSNAICTMDDTICTTVYVGGSVELCGFDMNLLYDGYYLEFVSMDNELDYDVIANHISNDNRIKFNFSSSKNKTKCGEVLKIKFKVKKNTIGSANISLSPISVIKVGGVNNKELIEAEYNIENGVVSIK